MLVDASHVAVTVISRSQLRASLLLWIFTMKSAITYDYDIARVLRFHRDRRESIVIDSRISCKSGPIRQLAFVTLTAVSLFVPNR